MRGCFNQIAPYLYAIDTTQTNLSSKNNFQFIVLSLFLSVFTQDYRKSNIRFRCNPSSPDLIRIFPG